MMGPDCEKLLNGITDVEKAIISAISVLSNSMNRINVHDVSHDEILVSMASPVSGISSAFNSMKVQCEQAQSLGNKLFTDVSSFNNSAGSPWTEIDNMMNGINMILSYKQSLKYIGEKSAMMGLLNMGLSLCVDTKYALLLYHDYLQRGYDYEYHDKTQQVVHKGINGKYTTGNIDQDFGENVNTPRPSYDPF